MDDEIQGWSGGGDCWREGGKGLWSHRRDDSDGQG